MDDVQTPSSTGAPMPAGPDGTPGGDFAMRLRGAWVPPVALGAMAAVVLVLVAIGLASAHRLAQWWWPLALLAVAVGVLMANALRGVRVRARGSDLVVERLLSRRRIPASTISDIHLSGIVNERIEVVRANGRTWAFTAADSPEADRRQLAGLAQRWLDAHGGPVPVQSGPLRDGERLGFAPSVDDCWQFAWLSVVGAVAVVVCGRRLVQGAVSPLQAWAAVGLLLVCLATIGELAGWFVWAGTTVLGDVIVVRRPLRPARRIPATTVEAMQVTMRSGRPGVRLLVDRRWVRLPLHVRAMDHPRALLRLASWLQLHGAPLEANDDVPGRGDRDEFVLLALAVSSFVGVAWLMGAHGAGGLWVVVASLAASALTRTRTLDQSRVDSTRPLLWSFQD